MNTENDLPETLAPITSLISKSEKAQQKLAPGTWQHSMLGDNLKALHLGEGLLRAGSAPTAGFARSDLQEALRAFTSMISKTEKFQAKFSPGTSQHTLQQNRLNALRRVETLISLKLDKT